MVIVRPINTVKDRDKEEKRTKERKKERVRYVYTFLSFFRSFVLSSLLVFQWHNLTVTWHSHSFLVDLKERKKERERKNETRIRKVG